jgi:hypothetical protein
MTDDTRGSGDAGVRVDFVAATEEMRRLYGPRWRYMTPEYRDPPDDAAREAAERTMRRWPDGDPMDQRPGEWWCCCPDGAPMERRMYLGEPYDPYHGPVLAVIIDTGQRFRWEVAYNGPRVAGDPFDVTFDAGYSDTLADARASAEHAAWEYITDCWPDKAKSARARVDAEGEESPGRS